MRCTVAKPTRPFTALAPISGAQRRFTARKIVICDIAQHGSTLTLEVGGGFTLYFLVERSVFEARSKWISRGAAG
jgi:hypothetical protein